MSKHKMTETPVEMPAEIVECANQLLHDYMTTGVGPSAELAKAGRFYYEQYLLGAEFDAIDDMRSVIIGQFKAASGTFNPMVAASFIMLVSAFEIAIRERCQKVQ